MSVPILTHRTNAAAARRQARKARIASEQRNRAVRTRPRDAVQMAERLRRRGIPVELRHEKHRPRHEKYRLRRVWDPGLIRGTFSRRTVTPSTSTTARTRTAARAYAVRTGSAAARAHRQVLTGAGRRTAPRGDDPSAAVETHIAATERFFDMDKPGLIIEAGLCVVQV